MISTAVQQTNTLPSAATIPNASKGAPSAATSIKSAEYTHLASESNEKMDKSNNPKSKTNIQNGIFNDVFKQLLAGAVAGGVAKSVIAPLDRTKIYFQTHPDKGYRIKGAYKFLRLTYEQNGLLSLWRGNSATMCRILPYSAVQFTSHEHIKTLLGLNDKSLNRPRSLHFLAGSMAGVTAQTLTYPLDRARAVMAVTVVGEYRHLGAVFQKIIKDEGIFALYRGFAPTILGVIPYAGVSFCTYENLIRLLKEYKIENDDEIFDQDPRLTHGERLICGAIAGLLGQTVSYPLDIVRRRMQTARQMGITGNKYASIIGTLTHVYRKEGLRRGWFKGVSMNFIKGPIATGTSFTVYDLVKTSLQCND